MKSRKVLYPGSFDPITFGHMNIIEKAINFFGDVVIAVMKNNAKSKGMFTLYERYEIIKEIYKDNKNVSVIYVPENKATIDIAMENNCIGIIRGLRNVTDYEQEVQMARINKLVSNNKIETLMLVADSQMQDISSSLVREMYYLDKDVSMFVHKVVIEKMDKKVI